MIENMSTNELRAWIKDLSVWDGDGHMSEKDYAIVNELIDVLATQRGEQ